MTIHPGTSHEPRPTPGATAEHPETDHVQYQNLVTLAAAHQDDLRQAAERRRRERLVQGGIGRGDRLDDHAHSQGHVSPQGRLAALRLRIGHALVTAGTLVEGRIAEDTARSR